VIEIVEDDFEDWLLVKFTGVDGVVYETDIPGEWWDQVHLIEARVESPHGTRQERSAHSPVSSWGMQTRRE
jgi:hypothetical protein